MNTAKTVNSFVDWRVSELLPKLENLATYNRVQRENGIKSQGLCGWKDLASKEASLLMANYPDKRPESEKEYGSCLNQISRLKKELKRTAQLQSSAQYNSEKIIAVIDEFGDALSFLFRSYKERQNSRYREQVSNRTEKSSRKVISLSSYLFKAEDVLTQVANGATLSDVEWRDVSCAIALATGRRMAEIHLSAQFAHAGDYLLLFTGQLKGKNRKLNEQKIRDCEFSIPSLLPANLILRGMDFLEKNDKRFSATEDPEKVNRRWSKVLNERAKEWAIIDNMTYKDFRKVYLRASMINAGVDPFDYLDFAKAVLGDKDAETIKVYQQYEVSKESLTML